MNYFVDNHPFLFCIALFFAWLVSLHVGYALGNLIEKIGKHRVSNIKQTLIESFHANEPISDGVISQLRRRLEVYRREDTRMREGNATYLKEVRTLNDALFRRARAIQYYKNYIAELEKHSTVNDKAHAIFRSHARAKIREDADKKKEGRMVRLKVLAEKMNQRSEP